MSERSFFAPTVLSTKKGNAAVVNLNSNRHVLRFKPGANKLFVFADFSGPNEKGTQGG